jgi:serine/threonine protein kinase
MRSLLAALDRVHNCGIIHCDTKPLFSFLYDMKKKV